MSLSVEIRPVVADDVPAIFEIVTACGVPRGWGWPANSAGMVATIDGTVHSFCAIKEIPFGVLIEEWWCYPTARGRRCLLELGKWIEEQAVALATRRGEAVKIGGVVRLDNEAHDKMLASRGYEVTAVVRTKTFEPATMEVAG